MDLGNEDAGRTPAEGGDGRSIMGMHGRRALLVGSSDDGTGSGSLGTVITS